MGVRENLGILRAQMTEIGELIARPEHELFASREAISKWSAAQHLDHSLKVCSAVLGSILEPSGSLPRGINFLGRLVLSLGWFPRGRGESPQSLRGTSATPQEIEASVGDIRRFLEMVDEHRVEAAKDPIVRHPYFGGLTASQALRFLVIHNRHHLRIINEVMKVRD